ncbi:MAG: hypothetical protein C4K49_09555 [Candidatus Thorarchaeota archaeon]|nr:MAG: hypothetical protein C4K49_09555 [Candidatus Thorarchaeota archaeon]
MRKSLLQHTSVWENDELRVDVPYSAAGVSTTVLLTSKFTGKMMLMDVGDGALRDLLSFGSTAFVNEADPIAITHGHFDHIGGIHTILGFMRMLKRSSPLNILVPVGCTEAISLVGAFKQSYAGSHPFRIQIHEIEDLSGFDTDFFKIQAVAVEHYGLENTSDEEVLMPALGFRVRVGNTVVGYTGDTRMCQGAERVVKDVDIAVIEATRKDTDPVDIPVHLSESEAKRLGTLAKQYILIHRTPTIAESSTGSTRATRSKREKCTPD